MKVLDVGCGPGSISVGLAQATQPGGYLVALDISKEIVEVAGRALADAGLESSCYECKAGSVYDLSSYEDSYFDVAFAHQVLQHLSAPVEALVELKRVVKPGGVIAIRDADYSSMLGYPNLRGIDRWRELYRETARRNNAQPDAGRYLVSWGRQAGFEEIQFTTSVMQYSSGDEESRKRWASDWADRSLKSDFAKQAVAYGIASADEMQSISEAWLEWGENADAVFYYVNGEVLLRVP